jgi:hypothetical protein
VVAARRNGGPHGDDLISVVGTGQHEEHDEQPLRNPGGSPRSDADEPRCGGDEGNDEEDTTVMESLESPGERSRQGPQAGPGLRAVT